MGHPPSPAPACPYLPAASRHRRGSQLPTETMSRFQTWPRRRGSGRSPRRSRSAPHPEHPRAKAQPDRGGPPATPSTRPLEWDRLGARCPQAAEPPANSRPGLRVPAASPQPPRCSTAAPLRLPAACAAPRPLPRRTPQRLGPDPAHRRLGGPRSARPHPAYLARGEPKGPTPPRGCRASQGRSREAVSLT